MGRTEAAARRGDGGGSAEKPIGRRIFLGLIGLGAAGIVVGAKVQSAVGNALSHVASQGGFGFGDLIPGANFFRLYTVTDGFPDIPDSDYHLEVGGLVRQHLDLSLDDLKAMPATRLVKDFQCVTGWRVPDVHWVGVRLGDIIDRAGRLPEAQAVEFTSYDGVYTESLTMAEAYRYDVIVAYEMLGAPVTYEHGGPARLYVAPMYGYKSCKWLRSIQLVQQPIPGFWEQQGYAIEAWIGSSNGRTDTPVD